MTFKVASGTLASAVAASGTFTVGYPTGTNAGTFQSAVGHKLVTGQNDVYTSPTDFSLTFGTSSITVTLASTMNTLPAGTSFWLQIEKVGDRDQHLQPNSAVERAVIANPMIVNLGAPDVADADGYCASQDLTSAGVFSVSTTAAAAIAAAALAGTADVPRNVVAAWTTAAVLTITGTDEYGNTVVESSASGTSLTGKKAFKTVTGISSSANITGLTVGTGDVLGLPVFIKDKADILAELKDGALESRNSEKIYLSSRFADISTAESIWFASPVAGRVSKVSTILHGAITVGDATVTTEINGTAIDGLSITVAQSGSAAGDVDSDTPTAGHASAVVAVGDKIEVITDGGSTTAAIATVIVEIEPTHTLKGTLVAGVDVVATATSGDVRGTYDPALACDGSLSFQLLANVPNPDYLGMDQYDG